jgi:phage portal protein BeeE
MTWQFITYTLLPWIKRWESEIRLKPSSSEGQLPAVTPSPMAAAISVLDQLISHRETGEHPLPDRRGPY